MDRSGFWCVNVAAAQIGYTACGPVSLLCRAGSWQLPLLRPRRELGPLAFCGRLLLAAGAGMGGLLDLPPVPTQERGGAGGQRLALPIMLLIRNEGA